MLALQTHREIVLPGGIQSAKDNGQSQILATRVGSGCLGNLRPQSERGRVVAAVESGRCDQDENYRPESARPSNAPY